MRARSSHLDEVITDSHSRRLLVDVFHGADRVMQGVELTDWELDWDLTRDVKMSGSATIAYQSVSGESLVPAGTSGVLSPFRAKLLLTMEVSAGDFTELITLGWARIITAPSGVDYYTDTPFGRYVVASVVEIEFLGLEENVRRRGFRSPEQPPSLTSTYAELRRITGMTVVQTVSDNTIPAGTTYETAKGGRLAATQLLFGNIGCIGVINQAGQWVGVPKVAGASVGALALGQSGTVTEVGYEVDTNDIYNCVAGTFEDANRNPIYAVAEEKTGDLSVEGPYGENTLPYSQTTPVSGQSEADRIVQALLTQSIGGQTYLVPIKCIANPVIEIGDVLDVTGWTRPLQGRLIKARMTKEAVMDVTLEVQRSFS
jgi:hypothetical protein